MIRWQGYSRLNNSGQPAPSATVTVYNKGTNILSTLYQNDNALLATPLANPFTAGTDGYAFFYAANGRYDIQFSGGGITNPWSYGDVALYDPGTIGS